MKHKEKKELKSTGTDKPLKIRQKPGRKTKNNSELWARRLQEWRLWSTGCTRTEIAEQFGLTFDAVDYDLKQMKLFEPVAEAKDKIQGHFCEVIRTCFEKIKSPGIAEAIKVQYTREITEAATRLARLLGFDKETSNIFINQTLQAGTVNPYDKFDDDSVAEEFKRRRMLIQSKFNAKVKE